MHDLLFANNKKLEDDHLESYAAQLDLNLQYWKDCYGQAKYQYKIKNDQKIAMGLGARGTPAFFINGRFLSGAQPYEKFKKLIDEELQKAKNSGLSRSEYYRKAVEEKGKKKI